MAGQECLLVRYLFILSFILRSFADAEVDLAFWLRRSERRIYSQNGEDGMISVLLDAIEEVSATSLLPFFVEFGVEDGLECNTRHLREGPRQWKGVTMDGSHENQDLNLFKRFVSAENVNSLFQSIGVPRDPAVLSIDLDMNDFHVWRSILENGRVRATVTIIEMNSSIGPDDAVTVPYNADAQWDGTHFYGASLKALNSLAQRHGYALAACGK